MNRKDRQTKWFNDARRLHAGAAALSVVVAFVNAVGCREQRVEYHKRPAFYEKASSEKLPDEVVLSDGTIVKYNALQGPALRAREGDETSKLFQIREEHEDGTITLNALLPEHVLVNALTCVRNQEYQLLYEQLLSEQTKKAYEQKEGGIEEFLSFFRKNRHDLTGTLTRMVAGLPAQDVNFTSLGHGVTRCKLRPQISAQFKFTTVDVVSEAGTLKLLMIQ